MNNGFDEAYASYLLSLEKLDRTEEIGEKSLLFRQLTQQLGDLESRLDALSLRGSACKQP